MARIRVPAQAQGRADGLWKHTCFEAFIAVRGSPEYFELNFSPGGQWAVYHFDAYREGLAVAQIASTPQISAHLSQQALQLDVTVQLPRPAGKLAIATVVEEDNGRLCYWAARHPPGRPDFHHCDGFVFEL
jgi:hypothetical protein